MKRLIYLLLILTIFIGTMPEKSYGEVDYVDFIDVKIESNKEYNEIIKMDLIYMIGLIKIFLFLK